MEKWDMKIKIHRIFLSVRHEGMTRAINDTSSLTTRQKMYSLTPKKKKKKNNTQLWRSWQCGNDEDKEYIYCNIWKNTKKLSEHTYLSMFMDMRNWLWNTIWNLYETVNLHNFASLNLYLWRRASCVSHTHVYSSIERYHYQGKFSYISS